MTRTDTENGPQFTLTSAELLKALKITTGDLFDLWQEPMSGTITIITCDHAEYNP